MDPMSKVISAILGGLVGFGMGQGLGREDLLEAAGVAEADLADPDGLVPYQSLVDVWQLLVDRFPGEALGLRYAAMQSLELYGLVGQLCLAAPTAAEAIAHVQRYLSLTDPYMDLTVSGVDEGYRMAMMHEPQVYALGEPVELIVSATVRLSLQAMGVTMASSAFLREVAFRHRRRHPEALYAEFFCCPVRFEADYDGVTFDPAVLDRPMPGANPQVARYLERLAAQLLEERETEEETPRSPLLRLLHDTLGSALTAGEATAPEVARRMGMSARTLQRRLSAEETSYREQLEAHRRAQACRLLRDPERHAGEIAYLLGYADPAHFFRNFRRWTGATPQQWRRDEA